MFSPMPLPFFKRRPNADGSIDVKAMAAPDGPAAELPAAIWSKAAPDLGDYSVDHPDPLPAAGRLLPVLFWAALCGLAGVYVYCLQIDGTMRKEYRTAQESLRQETARKADLEAKLKILSVKLDDLHVLTRWADLVCPARDIVTAVLQSANERIQIRSLELQRKEPTVLRYNLQVTCTGGQQNFDAMKSDLQARLTDAGWAVTDSPLENEDARLIIVFSLVRKSS